MATGKDILNELEELNSPLAKISRGMPYQVPESYFTSLPERVYQSASLYQEEAPENMPYEVPTGYFETLPAQVLEQAKKTPTPSKRSLPLWHKVRWAAAAMLIIAVGLGSYRTLTPQNISLEEQLSTIPADDLQSYLQDNIDEFDTETIASQMSSVNTTNINNEINNDAIEYYLESAGWQ